MVELCRIQLLSLSGSGKAEDMESAGGTRVSCKVPRLSGPLWEAVSESMGRSVAGTDFPLSEGGNCTGEAGLGRNAACPAPVWREEEQA